jgi:DNA-binding transcriptional regulator GbsR (MarR family)
MDAIRDAIIEDFGNGYVRFGHSELMGRLVGLLICAHEPLTVDQMSEMLETSKSPVNQIARRLEELNLIRRVWVRGDRKHYYQIAADVFQQASLNLMKLYEDNLRVADRHLRAVTKQYAHAGPEERKGLRQTGERMIAMREFYTNLINTYHRFIADWKVARAHLISFEEYVAKIEAEARAAAGGTVPA